MNSIENVQAAKTSELVAFWNANCEAVGKTAVKKFTNKEIAVKRCVELIAAIDAKADEARGEVEPIEPKTDEQVEPVEQVAPIVEKKVEHSIDHTRTVTDKVVHTTVETTVETKVEHIEEEAAEDAADAPAEPFNAMQSVMSAFYGTSTVPTSMASLPASVKHELSDQVVPEKATESSPKRSASNADGVAASWSDAEVRTARLTRNGVRVTDPSGASQEFKSVNEAFRHYRLPTSKHIRFRGALKTSPGQSLAFEHDGKSYQFLVLN